MSLSILKKSLLNLNPGVILNFNAFSYTVSDKDDNSTKISM